MSVDEMKNATFRMGQPSEMWLSVSSHVSPHMFWREDTWSEKTPWVNIWSSITKARFVGKLFLDKKYYAKHKYLLLWVETTGKCKPVYVYC